MYSGSVPSSPTLPSTISTYPPNSSSKIDPAAEETLQKIKQACEDKNINTIAHLLKTVSPELRQNSSTREAIVAALSSLKGQLQSTEEIRELKEMGGLEKIRQLLEAAEEDLIRQLGDAAGDYEGTSESKATDTLKPTEANLMEMYEKVQNLLKWCKDSELSLKREAFFNRRS